MVEQSDRGQFHRKAGLSDERVEQIIGNLLRVGVIVSALVVALGGILYLMHDARRPEPPLKDFRGQPEEFRTPISIFRNAVALNPLGLIMLGLLLLMATPVVRVLFSVVAFALQRDYLYVLFTVLVLVVLLYSLGSGYFTSINPP